MNPTEATLSDAKSPVHRGDLERLLQGEVARVDRHGGHLSVIALTLDRKAAENSTPWDDRLLAATVAEIDRNTRASDSFGHWEERLFLIVAPAMDLTEATGFAVKLRRLVAEGVGRPRASFGVAHYRRGESLYTLVERADAAMQSARRRGGDRVATEQRPLQASIRGVGEA